MNTTTSLFTGKLINLKPLDMEKDSKLFATWERDSEYHRLGNDDPARLFSARENKDWLENHFHEFIMFTIHSNEDDKVIGSIELMEIQWPSGDAWVGIGIGERDYWGKGYGTEAMKIILRYAFEELNLHRVSLSVFDYNKRAIRSYEKAGFQHEGVIRQYVMREGKTWGLVFMGILRDEWEASHHSAEIPALR